MKYSVLVVALASLVHGFKELNDGARIDSSKSLESYSIPMRNQRGSNVGERVAGVLSKFDDDEYNLISRMKTMETPPSPDAIDHYAANKHVGSRFTQSRTKRSLKFDENSKSQAAPAPNQQRSAYSPTAVQFGQDSSEKKPDGDNKRIFPELFGIGSPGYYGGGVGPYGHHAPHYNNHHGYPGYYPGAGGANYYPHHGGSYGNGFYPGGYQPHYPGGGSSSSAAAAASSSSGGGFNRPGLYGNNYFGGGYGGYGNGGYLPNGGVAPILSPAYGGYPGGGFLGGFFRDEDGKGSSAVTGGTGEKVKGSVSFEK